MGEKGGKEERRGGERQQDHNKTGTQDDDAWQSGKKRIENKGKEEKEKKIKEKEEKKKGGRKIGGKQRVRGRGEVEVREMVQYKGQTEKPE